MSILRGLNLESVHDRKGRINLSLVIKPTKDAHDSNHINLRLLARLCLSFFFSSIFIHYDQDKLWPRFDWYGPGFEIDRVRNRARY